MASNQLSDYSVLVFDVYGTLADWETGLYEALQPLLNRYPASKTWTRKDALTAFGSVETDLQAQYPNMLYSDLLAKVHQVLEERLKVLSGTGSSSSGSIEAAPAPTSGPSTAGASTSGADSSDRTASDDAHQAFGNSIRIWPIFKDTSAALHRLAKHFKLVVLSNVDRESFRHTHFALSEGPQPPDTGDSTFAKSKLNLYSYHAPSNSKNSFWRPQETEGSNSPFTLIVTAQDVGCYKPALGGFQAVLRYVAEHPDIFDAGENVEGVKGKTLSVAQSLIHDHVPAAKLGLSSVWIDRQTAVTCNEDVGGVRNWRWRFETLGEFADAVEKEVADRNASRKD